MLVEVGRSGRGAGARDRVSVKRLLVLVLVLSRSGSDGGGGPLLLVGPSLAFEQPLVPGLLALVLGLGQPSLDLLSRVRAGRLGLLERVGELDEVGLDERSLRGRR